MAVEELTRYRILWCDTHHCAQGWPYTDTPTECEAFLTAAVALKSVAPNPDVKPGCKFQEVSQMVVYASNRVSPRSQFGFK